jgi:disulfide bond formation protein DsbB
MQKIFGTLFEIVGWIQIVLSPTLIGIGIGFAVYYNFPNLIGMIIGISLAIIGTILGIIWATKKYKTTGTMDFLSRVSSTPDLDKMIENQNKKENINNKKNSR